MNVLQTMQMLEKFQKKLAASNREAILFDRKVEIAEKTEERKIDESSDVPLGKLDLDAEDVLGDEWYGASFFLLTISCIVLVEGREE